MRIVVIGGGIVGLAAAWKLLRSKAPPSSLVLFEKEEAVALHQSGHNSGVLHCGLHYRPGSQKAQLAVAGTREMIEFCSEHDVALEQCGKLVVAADASELPRLDELERRGRANGVRGLRRLNRHEMREREPHAAGIEALLVPEEGIVDFPGVCRALASQVETLGGSICLGAEVSAVHRDGREWVVETAVGEQRCDFIVACAGLHADRIARLAGFDPALRIVPFRGEYYQLASERRHLVRHMIYPVPDPQFPFLGVHLHRRIAGGVEGGPTAVVATAREGYRLRDIDLTDLVDALAGPGLWRFALRYPRMCATELGRSISATLFARALQRLVPEIRASDLAPAGSGVRAQAIYADGTLVEDFVFSGNEAALHVLNAPSPAATASLAIGDVIAAEVLARTGIVVDHRPQVTIP